MQLHIQGLRFAHPGMTVLGFLPHHRVEAVRAAACGREVKTGKAEQDRGGSTIDERKEYRRLDAALEHVTQEIGERHFAREYEGHRAREQSEQQQRTADLAKYGSTGNLNILATPYWNSNKPVTKRNRLRAVA